MSLNKTFLCLLQEQPKPVSKARKPVGAVSMFGGLDPGLLKRSMSVPEKGQPPGQIIMSEVKVHCHPGYIHSFRNSVLLVKFVIKLGPFA